MTMRVRDTEKHHLERALQSGEVVLDLGLFSARLQARTAALAGLLGDHLYNCYGPVPARFNATSLSDFRVNLRPPSWLRGFFRPQVLGTPESDFAFVPLPRAQASLAFEMGLNFQVALGYFGHVLLHAGVVAFDDRAVLMPAGSGAGKSTLSLVLMEAGARLLSDEFGLLDIESGALAAHPRPVSLKNEGIKAAHRLLGLRGVTEPLAETPKGHIAYRPLRDIDVADGAPPATPSLIVFPSFRRGAGSVIKAVSAPDAANRLIASSTNYPLMGEAGFRAVQRLVRRVPAFEIHYGSSEAGEAIVQQLLREEAVTDAA